MLGAAEGAYRDYIEITRVRESAIFRSPVAEQVPVQERLAETAAELKAARLLRKHNDDLLHERGAAMEGLTAVENMENGRDRAYVARLCVQAVTRLVRQMGAVGLSDENPVQRHFRDVERHGDANRRQLGPPHGALRQVVTGRAHRRSAARRKNASCRADLRPGGLSASNRVCRRTVA